LTVPVGMQVSSKFSCKALWRVYSYSLDALLTPHQHALIAGWEIHTNICRLLNS